MNQPSLNHGKSPVKQAVDIAVNLGLIFILVSLCLQILAPFISLIVWGAVIAIAVYTPFLKLKAAVGGSNKRAVVLFALIGLSVVIVPAYMFAESMVESMAGVGKSIAEGTLEIPPPADSVRDWPLVGKKVHTAWSGAAENLTDWLKTNETAVREISKTVFGKLASTGIGVLQFLASILIAAAFLSSAKSAAIGSERFFKRLAGDNGTDMLNLSVSTIRSVAVGVLGIAAIQAILGGVGMVLVGVPATGVWVLLTFIVAIAQLPPWLVLGPIIFYVFSVESTTVAVIFGIWSLLVSFADMVLKPMLLGRGVEAPMLVILLGAIGGMIVAGIIGLFVGAVVLALGYKLFIAWLNEGEDDGAEAEAAAETEAEPATTFE